MRRRFGHRCMVTLYLIGSVALGVFAYHLQRPVYHPSPPPGEMYAVVFAHDPAAHLRLSADIYPNKPWYDSLNVVVGHVPRSQAGWLLVVECPGREPQSHAAKLYSAVTLQTRPARSLVTVKLGTGNKSNILFGCVQAPKSAAGAPGYSTNLANVSVAALQLDDGMVGAAGLPVLDAWPSSPGSPIPTLLQVFPSANCPSEAPVSTASTSPVAPASTQSSGGSTARSPQASPSQASSLPSPAPSPRRPRPRPRILAASEPWLRLRPKSPNMLFRSRNRPPRRLITSLREITRIFDVPDREYSNREQWLGRHHMAGAVCPRIQTSPRRTPQLS